MRSALTVARVTSLLGVFLAVSMLMGIIGAGLLAPVVGAAGFAARESVGMFERLPGDLEQNPLAQQSRILAADGSVIATPAKQNRIIVASEDISQAMKDAQVAIEDERFFQHGGMDLEALARAVVQNATTDNTQGGSTLTQQYIKLALVEQAVKENDAEAWNAAQARSGMEGYIRKLRELKYAITLEERLTKDDILTGYLNLAFYGNNSYGVEAASRNYFDKNASELTVAEAALLAGIVRSPSTTNPVTNPDAAQARRDLVIAKMLELGMIDQAEADEAFAVEVEDRLRTDSQRSCLNSRNPYFCDYVEAWLMTQPALGDTREERYENLTTNGLTVETTLDLELSDQLHEILLEATPYDNDYYLASAASVVEPGTGHVLAFNQSSEYSFEESTDKIEKTSVNWNVDDRFGGPGGMEVGSVAKAYTIVEALEKGVPVEAEISIREPGTATWGNVWLDNPEEPVPPQDWPTDPDDIFDAAVFLPEDFDEGCTIGEEYWTVRNSGDNQMPEEMSLRDASAQSVNTAFASLASQVGTCDIGDTMSAMGLQNSRGGVYGEDPGNPDSRLATSLVLGSDWASPLTVASSYATFASGGIYCPPVPVTRITDANGNELPLEVGECERAIDEDIAHASIELLKGVVSPVGSGYLAVLDDERPSAGKTGTNNNASHTWFAGFTPQLSTAVFVGNVPGAARSPETLVDIQVGDRYIEGPLYGSSLAAPTWKLIMDWALRDTEPQDWPEPTEELLNGKRVTIPDVVGLTVEDAQEELRDAGLTGTIERVSSSRPEGVVAYTTPGVGSSIQTSQPVVLHVSSGFALPSTSPSQPAPAPPQPPSQPAPAPQPPPQSEPPPTTEPEPEPPADEPEPEPPADEPEPPPAPAPPPSPAPPPADPPGNPDPPGDDEDED